MINWILSNYFSFYLASAVTYAPNAIFWMHLAATNRPKFLKNGRVIMINPFIAVFTKRYIVFLADVLKYLDIWNTSCMKIYKLLRFCSQNYHIVVFTKIIKFFAEKFIHLNFLPLEYKARSNRSNHESEELKSP